MGENRDTSNSIQTWKEAKDKFKKNECVQFAKMYNDFVNKVWDLLLCHICRKEKDDIIPEISKSLSIVNEDSKEEEKQIISSHQGHDGKTDQDVHNTIGKKLQNIEINEEHQQNIEEMSNVLLNA